MNVGDLAIGSAGPWGRSYCLTSPPHTCRAPAVGAESCGPELPENPTVRVCRVPNGLQRASSLPLLLSAVLQGNRKGSILCGSGNRSREVKYFIQGHALGRLEPPMYPQSQQAAPLAGVSQWRTCGIWDGTVQCLGFAGCLRSWAFEH